MSSDVIWISIAFVFGFLARQVSLPPLVGFLGAGFLLNAFGVTGQETLQRFADLGVTLLLFTIGLKLKVGSLLRPEIWAVATGHMLVTEIILGLVLYGLGVAGLAAFAGFDLQLAMLVAFALSFSSTVFAVKVLEEKGEMASLHGRISIGILIMQDIAAVTFLAVSMGKLPSPWALGLLALLPLRRLLMYLMDRSGHGEVLILYGLLLALGGTQAFELVNLKGDLGALILGILVANHPKAPELARSLLGFKDLFLVGFFLSIGLSGVPTLQAVGIALWLVLAVPLKVVLFFFLLTRFRLRARTSLLTSLSLANYSEFGLIVGSIGLKNGWLNAEWLVIIAIALSITFVFAAPLNAAANPLYAQFEPWLRRFETKARLPGDQPIDIGDASMIVFGMGRVGTGAYDAMRERYGASVLGIDFDMETVSEHQKAGRNVILSDATDPDFWQRCQTHGDQIQVVMLTMPSHTENIYIVDQLRARDYRGRIAATAKYPDEVEHLREVGVEAAFNIYAEAGTGFAEHVCTLLNPTQEEQRVS
jgi:glutathione-regulated potassium-efflux system ancillary protein KefC